MNFDTVITARSVMDAKAATDNLIEAVNRASELLKTLSSRIEALEAKVEAIGSKKNAKTEAKE